MQATAITMDTKGHSGRRYRGGVQRPCTESFAEAYMTRYTTTNMTGTKAAGSDFVVSSEKERHLNLCRIEPRCLYVTTIRARIANAA